VNKRLAHFAADRNSGLGYSLFVAIVAIIVIGAVAAVGANISIRFEPPVTYLH
jgi:hypothetical protein